MEYAHASTSRAGKCKHGIIKDFCEHCNGYDDQARKTAQRKRETTAEMTQLKEKYEVLKDKYRNFSELWTEDEIDTVYTNVLLAEIDTKEFQRLLYKTAIELERTVGAIRRMKLILCIPTYCWLRSISIRKSFRDCYIKQLSSWNVLSGPSGGVTSI